LGLGESAAADGTLVPTYDDNLLAAHHVRYGATGGIAYRHIADNYVALFTHFIPSAVHEAVYILDGLSKNTSDVQPSRLPADTHGQSTVVFALAYPLGIELMPRIRNWQSLTLFSVEKEFGCRGTARLYCDSIDWDLITDHCEAYLRVVLAIQTGRASASWILTRFNSQSRNHRLYRAFQELGRVVRTVYLIHWICMDDLRSSVIDASNKVESFHQFSSHLSLGCNGVLRTNEPEEHEKAIIYNGV
jgi:TnpA family transposase